MKALVTLVLIVDTKNLDDETVARAVENHIKHNDLNEVVRDGLLHSRECINDNGPEPRLMAADALIHEANKLAAGIASGAVRTVALKWSDTKKNMDRVHVSVSAVHGRSLSEFMKS